jgi:gluconolactonase
MGVFAVGLGFPEAPVLLPGGDLLVVEMDPGKGCITRLARDGATRRTIAQTGRPNGLALDRDGFLWVAETAQRALLRMDLDGRSETIADGCDGAKFLFLNDLAFAPNGDVYLTDSGVELEDLAPGGVANPDYRSLRYDGRVFRVDVRTHTVECIDHGLLFANGIAFGPDGALFVAETLSGNIYRYTLRNGRPTGTRKTFANVIAHFDPAVLQGPDGMKFAADGRLFVCVFGQGDVTVLDRQGRVEARIRTQGSHPTNLAFGAPGSGHIYVTEVDTGSVQILRVDADGLPLHG